MDAVILAAGKGTRMAPLASDTHKGTLPVMGRSLLWRQLDALHEAGVTKVVFIVEHCAEAVQEHVDAWPGTMERVYVRQGKPEGTAHAAGKAAGHVGDALLIMGDCITDAATLKALAEHPFSVAGLEVPNPSEYGVFEVQDDVLVAVHEKPEHPPTNLINTGIYHLPAKAFEDAKQVEKSSRGEYEFTDVLSKHMGSIRVITASRWIDVGTPWDLLQAQETIATEWMDFLMDGETVSGTGTVEDGVHVRGRLYAASGAVVRSGVYIEGDVVIGEGAKVGPNCYLRGPITIGAGCHVGANVEIKNSILLPHANAPHHNYVGDSILGSGVNLGAGTKVANLKVTPNTIRVNQNGKVRDTKRRKFGVVCGDGVKTGINCSINPGTLIGAGSLIGPGQVVSGWIEPASKLF